jgi:sec-independent protein translocase protein TatA
MVNYFVVVLLIFGGSKLKSLGSDLGSSIKGFKKAVKDDESKEEKRKRRLKLFQIGFLEILIILY